MLLRHGLSRGTLVGETGSGVEGAATSLPLPFFFSFLFFLLEPEKPPVKARVRLRDELSATEVRDPSLDSTFAAAAALAYFGELSLLESSSELFCREAIGCRLLNDVFGVVSLDPLPLPPPLLAMMRGGPADVAPPHNARNALVTSEACRVSCGASDLDFDRVSPACGCLRKLPSDSMMGR